MYFVGYLYEDYHDARSLERKVSTIITHNFKNSFAVSCAWAIALKEDWTYLRTGCSWKHLELTDSKLQDGQIWNFITGMYHEELLG
jgi:hypothetical protein